MLKECENDEIQVQYSLKDESFDYAFGREKRTGYEIEKIEVWIPALSEWVDFTHKDNEILELKAKQLIEAKENK